MTHAVKDAIATLGVALAAIITAALVAGSVYARDTPDADNALSVVADWIGVQTTPHASLSPTLKPCPSGAGIVVTDGDPMPCNLDGGNTLTVLGVDVAACDHMGGVYVVPGVCYNPDV
jgi:hypothetical protein